MVNSFHIFSRFSGLRPNASKSEIAGIGVLKWVKVAVCGIQCVDSVLDTIKILGTHFSYNDKLKEERNFLCSWRLPLTHFSTRKKHFSLRKGLN